MVTPLSACEESHDFMVWQGDKRKLASEYSAVTLSEMDSERQGGSLKSRDVVRPVGPAPAALAQAHPVNFLLGQSYLYAAHYTHAAHVRQFSPILDSAQRFPQAVATSSLSTLVQLSARTLISRATSPSVPVRACSSQ
jgi:hypothetical protein